MNRFNEIFLDKDDDSPIARAFLADKRIVLLGHLHTFCEESNMIEGIYDEEADMDHVKRMKTFLALETLTVADLCTFNKGHGILRTNGECVQVGNHMPPKGGQHIFYHLNDIVEKANNGGRPYKVHHEFETLHPFTDGNGRTGRAVWLWQMFNQNYYNIQYHFLQMWYYQSLSEGQDRK